MRPSKRRRAATRDATTAAMIVVLFFGFEEEGDDEFVFEGVEFDPLPLPLPLPLSLSPPDEGAELEELESAGSDKLEDVFWGFKDPDEVEVGGTKEEFDWLGDDEESEDEESEDGSEEMEWLVVVGVEWVAEVGVGAAL
jgi:hypothetical protein